MTLKSRRPPYVMPSYSLTGDLLAYLHCGLQYRYHNRGALPPSTPVQLWFGEFIHGVMEESYLWWKSAGDAFPWAWKDKIHEIEEYVDRYRLRPKGLLPPPNLYDPTGQAELLASRRAVEAINTWGPHLFPLIQSPEVKLKGIRPLTPPSIRPRADYYEIQGIADVIGTVNILKADRGNELVSALDAQLGDLSRFGDEYEILVDYKGMRRPKLADPTWKQFEWQLRTYAWLRSAQPDAKPVAAGVILFLNELVPSADDIESLLEEAPMLGPPLTDVSPGPKDLSKLRAWSRKKTSTNLASRYPLVDLSLAFRRSRSLRIIPIDSATTDPSLEAFDRVVWQIEAAVDGEMSGQPISSQWEKVFLDPAYGNQRPGVQTCTACDFKSYCPMSAQKGNPIAP